MFIAVVTALGVAVGGVEGIASILSFGSLAVGFMTAIFVITLPREERNETEKKTSEKFDELSFTLKEWRSKTEELEKELEEKRQKAKELEELLERLEALNSLKEQQISAIRGELELLFKRNATRSKIWTILNSAVWFFIGLIVRSLLGF